jgi:hypothetical protein
MTDRITHRSHSEEVKMSTPVERTQHMTADLEEIKPIGAIAREQRRQLALIRYAPELLAAALDLVDPVR